MKLPELEEIEAVVDVEDLKPLVIERKGLKLLVKRLSSPLLNKRRRNVSVDLVQESLQLKKRMNVHKDKLLLTTSLHLKSFLVKILRERKVKNSEVVKPPENLELLLTVNHKKSLERHLHLVVVEAAILEVVVVEVLEATWKAVATEVTIVVVRIDLKDKDVVVRIDLKDKDVVHLVVALTSMVMRLKDHQGSTVQTLRTASLEEAILREAEVTTRAEAAEVTVRLEVVKRPNDYLKYVKYLIN